jgi:hypothetical protein
VEQDGLKVSYGSDAALPVPSGQGVTLLDIIWNSEGPEGVTPRFRFLAPAIARSGGSVSYELAEMDLQHLCDEFVLAALGENGPLPATVLLTLADRAIEFGVSDPDSTQYTEMFRLDGTTCIREVF